jgi:hypothetical protein
MLTSTPNNQGTSRMKSLSGFQKATVALVAASISLAYGSAIANGIEFPSGEMPPP